MCLAGPELSTPGAVVGADASDRHDGGPILSLASVMFLASPPPPGRKKGCVACVALFVGRRLLVGLPIPNETTSCYNTSRPLESIGQVGPARCEAVHWRLLGPPMCLVRASYLW